MLDDPFFQAIAARQDVLRAGHPNCPECGTDQVQLIKRSPPAGWKCRHCDHKFTHEPEGESQ